MAKKRNVTLEVEWTKKESVTLEVKRREYYFRLPKGVSVTRTLCKPESNNHFTIFKARKKLKVFGKHRQESGHVIQQEELFMQVITTTTTTEP